MFFKKWIFLVRYFIFWILLFAAHRLVFLALYFGKISNEPFTRILASFYHALYLDVSAASYITVIPAILLSLAYIFQRNGFLKALNIYTILLIFIYTFIAIGEDGIYGEWNTKLNYLALWHFRHFDEVMKTISLPLMAGFFAASGIIGGLFTWLYMRKVRLRELYSEMKYPWLRYTTGILLMGLYCGLLFLGIRGGWMPIPINQSVSYYCSVPILNDAAVNPAWNLASNISENSYNLDKNPFEVMPYAEAHSIVDELYETEKDTTINILTTSQPNICFIILESWSASLVGSCGGMQGVTPVFDSLSEKGVLFSNMESSAILSDQGIPAILSGHPHTYRLFLCRQPEKSKKVGSLSRSLHQDGYQTAFYFGGQLSYGNIKSYLYNQSFDIIKEGSDYDASLPRARLGIHDGVMMQEYAKSLSLAKQPFLYCMFTISSHMPYDIPVPHKFDDLKDEGKYASSVHYTDQSLGEFLQAVRYEPWYKNTLFVIVADHSHNAPVHLLMQEPEFHHIPCLFFGEVIKPEFRGKNITRKVMQADIAATIMHQLGKDASAFPWSRNMLNPYTKPWAFYLMHQGGGFVYDTNYVAFDTFKNSFFFSSFTDSTDYKPLLRKGEAIQQVLFDEFLKF
jgi:phosphoglycerol transferase MdoB-like AlkP superfamily enzyme